MERHVARMITLLARKSQSYIGNTLSKYNLSAAEQPFFMALQFKQGQTQEEMTALVSVDKAATARAVKSLEDKGYLIRIQDCRDRRQNRIYPTEAANQIADDVRRELSLFNELLTRGIDGQTVGLVYEALVKMEENFKDIYDARAEEAWQGGVYNGSDKNA